jgi:hypothetical protein
MTPQRTTETPQTGHVDPDGCRFRLSLHPGNQHNTSAMCRMTRVNKTVYLVMPLDTRTAKGKLEDTYSPQKAV